MAMNDRGMGENVKGAATVVCLEVRIRYMPQGPEENSKSPILSVRTLSYISQSTE